MLETTVVQQSSIFGPMLTTMLLTLWVWVFMYARRIPFINSLEIEPDKLTPAELARLSPPSVSNPSDNLKNLFELPPVFYALALYLYVIQSVDMVYLWAAWGFVFFRLLHSLVHCTANIVMLRFGLYVCSSLCLFFLLLRATLSHFGVP